MEDDGCCAVYESCSLHYDMLIGMIVLVILIVGILAVLIACCVQRYLKQRKEEEQQRREACGTDDLRTEESIFPEKR